MPDKAWARPKEPPVLGTPEARERIRRSGVPLDEWVDITSPAWRAKMEARERSERRFQRGFVALIVAGIVAVFGWGILHPEPLPSERMAACTPDGGLPCTFERADGVVMVRALHPERGVEEYTAADFDESYLMWLEDMAPDCPSVGPMSAC
jgi:hypothetical protein